MTRSTRALLFVTAVVLPVSASAQSVGSGGGRGAPGPGGAPPIIRTAPEATALGAGAISGVVIDGATKTPLADTVVSISSNGRATGLQTRQVTDSKGRFVFSNLPAGSGYSIRASHFGYLDSGAGKDRVGSTALREGEWVSDVRVAMWRPGAIGGTVVDERGEPVAGILVRALARVRLAGHDQLAAGPMTTTDDRGMYRIGGLAPGRYLVQVPSVQMSQPANPPSGLRLSASAPSLDGDTDARLLLRNFPTPPPPVEGRRFTYPPIFYPGMASVGGATTIDLGFAEDRGNIDIALQPVPANRVSGTIEGPADTLAGLTVRLLPEGLENLGYGSEAATALPDAGGRFTFLNVAAGRYIVDAPRVFNQLSIGAPAGAIVSLGSGVAPPPGTGGSSSSSRPLVTAPSDATYSTQSFRGNPTPYFAGRAVVVVNGRDENDVVVTMRPLAVMTGRILTDLDPSKPAPASQPRSALHLEPAAGQPSLGMPTVDPVPAGQAPTQEFRIQGVMPGAYVVRAGGEWLVKSITWKGRDYTDRPIDAAAEADLAGIDVTLTNAAAVVSGKVRDAQGNPAAGAIVWFFPADPAARIDFGYAPQRLKSAVAEHDGTYRVASLAAGDYYAIAVADFSSLALDEESLRSAERSATRVTLAWGETKSQDFALRSVR